MYEPLISREVVLQYLKTKPVIRNYFALKRYRLSDINENRNLELWLACLMGKITEKEKRCIENIDSISDLHSSNHENVFLVLKYLFNFWNEKVSDFYLK